MFFGSVIVGSLTRLGRHMSRALCLRLLTALSLLSQVSNAETVLPEDRVAKVEERRLLVAFRDGSIDRVPSGDSTNGYRRRGRYGTSTFGDRSTGELAERYALERMDQWPIPAIGMHCAVYRVPGNRSVQQTIDRLQRDESVDLVERMRTFRTLTLEGDDPYARLQPGLDRMHIRAVHPRFTGVGVRVAVIDTGIDTAHPDLAERIVGAQNFTAHDDATTADIHGTAVAGIIAAAARNHTGIVGVAPDARILSLKACWPEQPGKPAAVCDTFTLAQALNTAIQQQVRIVNLSLAGPADPLLELLIRKGIDQGMIFVSSVPPDGSSTRFPSSVEGVIAVRSAGSAAAPAELAAHAVAAPGNEILTTLPRDGYNFVNGSSYATAHISGLIALMLQAKGDLGSASALSILQQSSPKSPANGGRSEPVVDACLAINRLGPASACSESLPGQDNQRP